MIKSGLHTYAGHRPQHTGLARPPLPLSSQNRVHIIGVMASPGSPISGCEKAIVLMQDGFLRQELQNHQLALSWQRFVRPHLHAHSHASSLHQVNILCQELKHEVMNMIEQDHFFAVIGGDHASAIGTWSGAYQGCLEKGQEGFGLIWIDAHMDSHTPESSPTQALHGMPLACLLGHGPQTLTELAYPGPALSPEHTCLIGVRSYQPAERQLLERLGVTVFYMEDVHRLGLAEVMQRALDIVTQDDWSFGITLDMDSIDPEDAPGVSVPEPEGIRASELLGCLYEIRMQPGYLGFEVSEYNPLNDTYMQTAHLVSHLVASLVPGGGAHA